jgi:hypothetical protein
MWRKETNAYVYDLEELILNRLPIQSAVSPFLSGAWLRIAVSIFPAATMRSRLTAWVLELKRQLDVAVAKQSLHSLWISSDQDEK